MNNFLKRFSFLFLCALACGASFSTYAQTRAWGGNNGGQLGNGTQTQQTSPVTISAATDAVGVASGYHHTIFLRPDGTLLAVGRNSEGELGFGTTSLPVTTPAAVPNLRDVRQATAGTYHTAVLKTDGTVWSFGFNQQGQIGNGTTGGTSNSVLEPARALNLTNVVQIDAGAYHTLALKADGTVWAWGHNNAGQLGTGFSAPASENAPVRVGVGVAGFEDIVAVAGGESHSAALKADGTVWVWGYNGSGQLGNGIASNTYVYSPVQNQTLSGIMQIAVGSYFNVALKRDGTVFVWGDNTYGQVGNGVSGDDQTVPVQNETLSEIVEVAAGAGHAIAKTRGGEVWAWGDNFYGQMGRTTSGNIFRVPLKAFASNLNAVIAAGDFQNFVIRPNVSTPAGTNIRRAGSNVSFEFPSITTAGTTSYRAHDLTAASLPVPAGYELKMNAPAYNVTTTATTAGDYMVCLNVPSAASREEFNRLRLMHGENGAFVNRTASSDLRKREICATVNQPGVFTVALAPLAPTAAEAIIAGKVGQQKGIPGAIVYLTDANGATRTARTNAFGYFRFENVAAGGFYFISVVHKRHQFAPRPLNVNEDVTDLIFEPVE